HIHDQVLGRADVQRKRSWRDPIEAHARAVRGGGKRLRAIAAVYFHRVDARAAFIQIRSLTRVPDHSVVASLAEDLIVTRVAGKHIGSVAAKKEVRPALAKQDVVARLPEELVVPRPACEHVVAIAAE